MMTLILTAHLSHLCIIMKTKNIVKASLFTLILAFVVATVAATGGVMKNREIMEAPKADPVDVNALSDKADDLPTWYFTGEEDNDPTNPNNYSHEPLEDKPCGAVKEVICQIEAPANSSGQPSMQDTVPGTTQTVGQQISNAAQSLNPNQTVKSFREE